MINFNNLELVVNEKYSFVGLERRNSQIRFCLPKGFPNKSEELQRFTFNTKRDLFFLLYKVFDQFKKICIEKGYLEDNNDMTTSDRDGMVKIHQGADISEDDELDENIFYSKLDMISGILKAHDEPKILSLVYRLGRSDSFDHSQIHKFLHRAVFYRMVLLILTRWTYPANRFAFSQQILWRCTVIFYGKSNSNFSKKLA